MKVAIVRSEPGASAFSSRLQAAGIDAIPAPVTTIQPVEADLPDLSRFQAIVFTSVHGVDRFAALSSDRSLPVFTVGDVTAAAARRAGFDQTSSAQSDVQGLSALIRQDCNPDDGPLLYPAGRNVAGDFEQLLQNSALRVERVVVYAAVAARRLPSDIRAAIRTRTIDAAVFFSVRNARLFARLVRDAGAESALASTYALCISKTVADALAAEKTSVAWQRIIVAAKPTADAVETAIGELASR